MVGAKDVLFLNVPRVQGAGQLSVFVMVEGKGANLKDVGRVHKAALISARLMVEEGAALGAFQDQGLETKSPLLVISSLGGKLAFVLITVHKCKTNVFMVVAHLILHCRDQNLAWLRR